MVQQIFIGSSAVISGDIDIRISEFDLALLGSIENDDEITREKIDVITGTNNRQAMIAGDRNGGATVVVVQSAQDDTLLRYVHDTLSEASKRQLTKTRPGLLMVGFGGVGVDGMIRVAKKDRDPSLQPSALRLTAHNFLSTGERDHVIGVGFMSQSELEPQSQFVDSGGSVYIFKKSDSSFWDNAFDGMFTPHATNAGSTT